MYKTPFGIHCDFLMENIIFRVKFDEITFWLMAQKREKKLCIPTGKKEGNLHQRWLWLRGAPEVNLIK